MINYATFSRNIDSHGIMYSVLELKNISFSPRDGSKRKILDQISLCINPGTLTVITGPNGSGKSTLAQIIMGLKAPTPGQIFLNNQNITRDDITTRAKKGISFSFQQPVKFKSLTVYELLNIASGELISQKSAGQYLRKVGLDPATYLPREISDKLSGGELKRIEIVSVLARKDSKLIIFDEPEAGIDLWSFTHLIKVFQKLKSENRTLIIISHQEKILKIADRIIVLENGKIKSAGSPTKILPIITGGKP